MRVAAISMAGIDLKTVHSYRSDLMNLIKKNPVDLAVLPAYSSILLGVSTGALKEADGFNAIICNALSSSADWNRDFMALHSSIARDLNIYLAAGTLFENDSERFYHSAYCFNRSGKICAGQRQTHLSQAERRMGLSRGDELEIFSLDDLKAGLIVGNDARHPEVGRIIGLQGADLVIHSGAIESGQVCWTQVAGIWSQVQQNQFWAVEAQLSGHLAGRSFGALCAVIGPCEITPGQSGYLAQGYLQTPLTAAELDETARHKLKKNYPLLELLNPKAYTDLYR